MSSDVRTIAEPMVAARLGAFLSERLARRLSIEIVGELIAEGLLEMPEGSQVEDFIGDLVVPKAPGEDEIRRTERVRVAARIRRYAADRSMWPNNMTGAAPSSDYQAGWSVALRVVADLLDAGLLGSDL